jgi:hypothetical protein
MTKEPPVSAGISTLIARRLKRRPVLLAAGLAAGLVATLGGSALAVNGSPGGDAAAAPPAATPDRLAAPSPRNAVDTKVTLVTGDSVRVERDAGGRTVVSPALPAGASRSPKEALSGSGGMVTFVLGGDIYAVPSTVLPQLGRTLDPALFNVSYLERAGYTAQSKLPLSIEWREAQHDPVPGLTAPRDGKRTAGSIDAAGTAAFGRALARDGADALGEVKKISLGAAPNADGVPGAVPLSTRTAAKGGQSYTLTISQLDRQGAEGNALIAIQNLDNADTYYSVHALAPGDGPVAVSLPAGPYGISAFIYDLNEAGLDENVTFVPADVTVSKDTAVTLDAREARPIDVTVPRADAEPMFASMKFARHSASGGSLQSLWWSYGPAVHEIVPPVRYFAKPTPAPRRGSLGFSHSWTFVPPGTALGGAPQEYLYNLDFPSENGVPAKLTRHLTAADLAIDHTRIGTLHPDFGGMNTMSPFHQWSILSVGLGTPIEGRFPLPAERTDYYGGSAATVWHRAVETLPDQPGDDYFPRIYAPLRTFRPGDEITTTWANGPSVPAPEWQNMGLPAGSYQQSGIAKVGNTYFCPVCRQGDVMGFNVVSSGDSDPTHTTSHYEYVTSGLANAGGGATSTLNFYRDGQLTQVAATSGQVFPMLPGTASYRIEWTQTRPEWATLGTRVETAWDFTSSTPAKNDRLPKHQECSPDVNHGCAYLPLIFGGYDFGTDLRGKVPAAGPHTFTVSGYYQRGVTGRQVTKASVQVSFDDGKTWAPAAVTALAGGKFRVSVQNPAASEGSGFASVKVNLSDSAGDSFEQTVIHAYGLVGA